LVSGKVGVLIIGIGIIIAVLLAPRGVLTPQKVTGFLGTFGLPKAQAETKDDLLIPKAQTLDELLKQGTPVLVNGFITDPSQIGTAGTQTLSPKPTQQQIISTAQITTTAKPTQIAGAVIDPTVTTAEERALVESEIARLKAEAGISSVTIDPTTGKQSFNIFLRERL